MNVVFATCQAQPDISTSDSVLARALESDGAVVSGAPWNGDFEPFLRAQVVVIRTTWDYFDHYPEFCRWLDRLETHGVQVLNSLAILRWNIHKSYLFDLKGAGAPVLPMVSVESDASSIQSAAVDNGWDKAVLKCLVSGTARGLSLFDSDSVEQVEQAIAVAAPWSQYGLVVQPFMPEIRDSGELSMVYVDGRFSHAVCKTPKSGEFSIQSEFGGQYARVDPDDAVMQSASDCLGLAGKLVGDAPLYARVDGLMVGGAFQLMELELAEPELMFNLAPEAAETMADAIRRRVA